MNDITLPNYSLRTREGKDGKKVYDSIRDRYVKLTPEERVRQLFIKFLVQERGVPAGLIRVEQGLEFKGKRLRVDVAVFDRNAQPLLVIECKAPSESVSQRTFDQLADYNYLLGAPYLVVTNGVNHYCCKVDTETGAVSFLSEMPRYDDLTSC